MKRPPLKYVGLAGLAGVAATGVVIARRRQARADVPADELRERLHSRLAEVQRAADPSGAGGAAPEGPSGSSGTEAS
jgi:hypothetical protein